MEARMRFGVGVLIVLQIGMIGNALGSTTLTADTTASTSLLPSTMESMDGKVIVSPTITRKGTVAVTSSLSSVASTNKPTTMPVIVLLDTVTSRGFFAVSTPSIGISPSTNIVSSSTSKVLPSSLSTSLSSSSSIMSETSIMMDTITTVAIVTFSSSSKLPTLSVPLSPSSSQKRSQSSSVSTPTTSPASKSIMSRSTSVPTASTTPTKNAEEENRKLLLYIAPPAGLLVLVCILIGTILCIRRYRRMRKWRLQLMPLHNLDNADSDEEELLNDDQAPTFQVSDEARQPILTFDD